MNHLYVDESGSMTIMHKENNPYFVIAIVRTENPEKCKRVYKRFISSRFDTLHRLDKEGKMFLNGKFRELKGNQFSPDLKRDFMDYFCRGNLFEVYYIVVRNKYIYSPAFYSNTARAFNYLMRIALETFIHQKFMDNTGFAIQLDERNERPDTKRFLQDYLNTELLLNGITIAESTTAYFDSANNKLIQVADVFANIMFSNLMTDGYSDELQRLQRDGYIKKIFYFP